MNEWHSIRYYWRHRLPSALAAFAVTMLATAALDLTQAIIVGLLLSLAVFLRQVAQLTVSVAPVDWDRLNIHLSPQPDVQVIYITGPLFFGSVNQFVERVEEMPFSKILVLSMRGVPMADVSSVQAIEHLWRTHATQGGTIYLTGVQPAVQQMLERAGLVAAIGAEHFFWSADQAIARISEVATLITADLQQETLPDETFDEMPLGVTTA